MSREQERAASDARTTGFGETIAAATVDLLEVIPADITTDAGGEPLDEATCQAIRGSRAREWALAGFTDPAQVRAWIQAGVVVAEIAETARRRGFRPGDPWVPRGWGAWGAQWRQGAQEPLAGPVQRRRNRRRARSAWTGQQRRHAEGRARHDRAAAALRQDVIAGSGASATFSAFDLAIFSTGGPDPELVAGTAVAIAFHADFLADLAESAQAQLLTHGPAETWAGLSDALSAGPVPTTDTHPDSAGPEGWITREATSLAGHSSYVHDFIGALRANLDRLDSAEAATVAALLDRSEARLHTARLAWAAIAERT